MIWTDGWINAIHEGPTDNHFSIEEHHATRVEILWRYRLRLARMEAEAWRMRWRLDMTYNAGIEDVLRERVVKSDHERGAEIQQLAEMEDAIRFDPEQSTLRTLILSAVERAVAEEKVKWLEIEKASRSRHAREIEQLRQHVSLAALYLSRLTNCSKCMTKIEHPDEIHRIGNYITAALAALDGETTP